jgi:hypothetical protein
MMSQAMCDGGGHRRAVFLGAAACRHELLIDDADRYPPGMIGLDRIHQL